MDCYVTFFGQTLLPISGVRMRRQEQLQTGTPHSCIIQLADVPSSTRLFRFYHLHDSRLMKMCSYEAACNFLDRNNLLGIIRGHEVQNQGYALQRL